MRTEKDKQRWDSAKVKIGHFKMTNATAQSVRQKLVDTFDDIDDIAVLKGYITEDEKPAFKEALKTVIRLKNLERDKGGLVQTQADTLAAIENSPMGDCVNKMTAEQYRADIAGQRKLTAKGMIWSTIGGGIYLGLPLYAAYKKRLEISSTLKDLKEDYKNNPNFWADRAGALQAKVTMKSTAVFLAAAAAFGVGNHIVNMNDNVSRGTHYGVGIGILGNAAGHAHRDDQAKTRGFWNSFGNRLWYKAGDVGETAVNGGIVAAKTASEVASATTEAAAATAAAITGPNDPEGNKIFSSDYAHKSVTICRKKDITAGEFNALSADEQKATRDSREEYFAKVDEAVDEMKQNAGGSLRATLASSANATVIIPGPKHPNEKLSVTKSPGCPDASYAETRHKAAEWMTKPGYR